MPWVTPSLEALRSLNRDNVTAQLRSGPMIPNSVLRVMSDSNAGVAYLTLLFINWLALQLLPDTAEKEWLDRFGSIWVGGRKPSTFASGIALLSGIAGAVVPAGTVLSAVGNAGAVGFQTTAPVTLGGGPTAVNIVAVAPGANGIPAGSVIGLSVALGGVNSQGTIAAMGDGSPQESDDELRVRVLDRIREPPMGGDAFDYVQWALAVPGVTRAWCAPNEMGIGTVVVRFMMDDLRADQGGFPTADDIAAVTAYLDTTRPVTVKDFWCVAPIPTPVDFTIRNLDPNTPETWQAIIASVNAMLLAKARPAYAVDGVLNPAQTIYAAWVSDAILKAAGVVSFDLAMSDAVMPDNGNMAVLGSVIHG